MDSILPADLTEFDGGITNFDHTIDDGVEDALRSRKHYCTHSAWHFNGKVWFDGENFVEEVWCYRSVVGVYRHATLQGLVDEVNDAHGHD